MKQLLLEPTATAQWQSLICEAEMACHKRLGPELQSYLVFLLMRFIAKPGIANTVMATEYLRGSQASGQVRVTRLRDVGDQCLLYSGLFPKRAERKLVRVSYFVGIGRSAYNELACALAQASAELYKHLSEAFVILMEVLQTIRTLGGDSLGLLHGIELWNDTGGMLGLRELALVSDGFPVRTDVETLHLHKFQKKSH